MSDATSTAQRWIAALKPQVFYPLWAVSAGLMALGVYRAAKAILDDPTWPFAATDLSVYITAARSIAEGYPPYASQLDPKNPYGYPPLFAELIALLRSVLGEGFLWVVWPIASAIALFASVVLLMRCFGWKAPWLVIVGVFGLLLNGDIVRSDLFHGQPHFFLLLLIVAGILAFRKGQTLGGALAWAGVIVCKPFAGIFVLALLRRGQYREAIYTLGCSAGLFFASFLPFAANLGDAFRGWLGATRFHTSFPNIAKSTNESFNGFFTRIFSENPFSTPWVIAPELVAWLGFAFIALALAGVWFGASSKQERERLAPAERDAHDLVEFSLALGLVLVFGPLMEGPHVFMILPGVFGAAIIAEHRWRSAASNKMWWLAASVAWLGVLGVFLIPFASSLTHPTWLGHLEGLMILISLKFGAAVAAACVVAFIALRIDRAKTNSNRTASSFALQHESAS